MRKIDKIFIHCSATPEGRDIKMETIKSWHVKGRGWRNIGYHFVIELDGTWKVGRPMEQMGAGVKGHNEHSIHVCYVGGLDKSKNPKDTRTQAQRETLNTIIGGLLKEYPDASVHGHNEFSNKACPSFDVQKEFGTPKKSKPKKSKSTPKAEE